MSIDSLEKMEPEVPADAGIFLDQPNSPKKSNEIEKIGRVLGAIDPFLHLSYGQRVARYVSLSAQASKSREPTSEDKPKPPPLTNRELSELYLHVGYLVDVDRQEEARWAANASCRSVVVIEEVPEPQTVSNHQLNLI